MRALLATAAACTLSLAACSGGGDTAKDCPPLEVTVDGQPVTFTSFFGVDQNGVGYLVQGFNHDKVTCSELLAASRSPPSEEVQVSSWIPNRGGPPANVGVGYHTQFGVETVLATKPSKEGDPIAACIPKKVTFTPKMGPMNGKTVTVQGLLAGRYCGAMKF